MSVTITDLFCGAGGSSLGAEYAGGTIELAANHWQTAIDVHQAHFPNARHDCADISRADPRRYPRTDILIASPECTNHSQARGISRKRQDPSLFDAPDPSAEKSRATMWDVIRFAEQIPYKAIVVENVVEATKWVLWRTWRAGLEDLGYTLTLLSHNSMHHGVPQSRDRIFAVWFRNGIRANLDMEVDGWCPRCDMWRPVRQAWKNGRTVGRYGQQWVWGCTTCHNPCQTVTQPAGSIIDWSLPCPRIGDRKGGATGRPLVAATRSRVGAGMLRYGWVPITTSGAGNVHERTPGNRARPLGEPLPTQQTTLTSAIATPPAFGLNTAHGGRIADLDEPHPTVCASDDRLSLVVQLRGTSPAAEPLGTVSAGGQHHGLIVTNNPNNVARSTTDPLAAVTTSGDRHALLMRNFTARGDQGQMSTPVSEPARTFGTTQVPALLMRNNTGGAEMLTSIDEPARTFISKPNQALLTAGTMGDVDMEALIDDCGFRMLEPYEVAAAMAFPVGYIPRELAKVHQVKLAGNAVCPPNMAWIIGRVIQALEAVA